MIENLPRNTLFNCRGDHAWRFRHMQLLFSCILQPKLCLQLLMATQESDMMIRPPSEGDLVQLCAEGRLIVFGLISNHLFLYIQQEPLICPDQRYCLCHFLQGGVILFYFFVTPELIEANINVQY